MPKNITPVGLSQQIKYNFEWKDLTLKESNKKLDAYVQITFTILSRQIYFDNVQHCQLNKFIEV